VRNKKKVAQRKRDRLPISRRTEIIQNKMRGIDDPEFCCTQNLKTKSWVVRKRKFPLDQTIRRDTPITKAEVKIEAPVEVPVEEKKKDDLQLEWANMKASKNDGLAKQLAELSSKFDQMAEKYEEKKKSKALKAKPKEEPKVEEAEYYTDEEDPPYPPPRVEPPPRPMTAPRQTPPPMQQQIFAPVGKYYRNGPIDLNQF
jgi:hypothetical protein